MNDRILIYNKYAFSEVVINDSAQEPFIFTLDRGQYHLTKDIIVKMMRMDDSWVFMPNPEYDVLRGDQSVVEKKLQTGDVLSIRTKSGEAVLAQIENDCTEIPQTVKYILNKEVRHHSIGSNSGCAISIDGIPSIKGNVGTIDFVGNNKTIDWAFTPIRGSACYLNGTFLEKQTVLKYGDKLDFLGLRIIFLGEVLAIEKPVNSKVRVQSKLDVADEETLNWLASISVYASDEDSTTLFSPAPRVITETPMEELEVEGPPAPASQHKQSLINTIGPSFTLVIPMLLGSYITGTNFGVGLFIMIGSALGMAFWAAKAFFDQKKNLKKEEANRVKRYTEYIAKREEMIKEEYELQQRLLNERYPSSMVCLGYDRNSMFLWSYNPTQSDYLFVRLGNGKRPFEKRIKIPQDKFVLFDDELRDEPKKIADEFAYLEHVPVGIDLSLFSLFGIVGGSDKSGCYSVLRVLITQLAANYNYTQMKLVLLCDEENSNDRNLIEATKWLPHMWSDDMTIRYAGEDEESRKETINAVASEIKDRFGLAGKSNVEFAQQFVIIATSPKFIANTVFEDIVYNPYIQLGVNCFLCASEYTELPNPCQYFIENTSKFTGSYCASDTVTAHQSIHFDNVSWAELNRFSHSLSSIHIQTKQKQADIPTMLTFLDMYGVGTTEELGIYERWTHNNSASSLQAPIGMGSGDQLCYLDLNEKAHGPHGLVAGTTGSGKSETLMSVILSLAVNFSPEDVSFLLVDFKGGGLANQFDNPNNRLPHLAGTITNLGGNQINRALISINSENIRRQRILAEAGVNDIYAYTKLYKNHEVTMPLPHLIIVVDEFAELKKQFPDFMSELISVAAIGRSLGVHLILATQKPAGVVDDKIESNSRFRICLKVQTEQDSKDMLKRPDAAYITQQGRGYLRVGADELLDLFQSAWTGATYSAGEAVAVDNIAYLYTITGKTELVGSHQKMVRKEQNAVNWIAKLKELVDEVYDREQVTIADYLSDSSVSDRINSVLYHEFALKGWNVTPSPMNNSRLMDFMFIYDICQRKDPDTPVSPAQIMALSREMGRALPEIAVKKQIDAVCELINAEVREHDLALRTKLWLPELPDQLYLSDLISSYSAEADIRESNKWSLSAWVGQFDDPKHQYQAPVVLDISSMGGYLICGTTGSGKSTFLQTMIYSLISRYTPKDVNLYILDFSSRMLECFESAPHVGSVMYENDIDSMDNFFFFLKHQLEDRKKLIHGGNYAQYVEHAESPLPAMVFVVDQYGAFREKTNEKYEEDVLTIIKEGVGYGIYCVFTSGGFGSSEVSSKVGDNIKGRICLELTSKFDYRNILTANTIDVTPKEGTKGRGLYSWHGDALEFQTAQSFAATSDFARSDQIKKEMQEILAKWNDKKAKRVPVIPENPTIQNFVEIDEVEELLKDDRHIPIGYDIRSAYPFSIDLSHMFCCVVSGKEKAGRTNFMALMLRMAAMKGGDIYLFGTGKGLLKKIAETVNAKYLRQDENLEPFCVDFRDDLLRRNGRKRDMEDQGMSEENIYLKMSQERNIYLFIEDLVQFTENLYRPPEGCNRVDGFFETLTDKGWYHQIFIFAGLNQDQNSSVKGRPFYENLIRDGMGIHFGGNVVAQQVLQFNYISSYKEQSQMEPPEIGLMATGDGSYPAGKIVVPEAKE